MLLYTCDGSGIDSFTNEELRGAECFTNGFSNSDPKQQCIIGNLVAAWAVGGTVRRNVVEMISETNDSCFGH